MGVSRKIRFGALIKNSMETKEITKTIYIANDGKEFLTKEDCEKHERFVEEILSRIKYFCIRCNPDLTETGNFSHKIYVAVFSKHYLYKDIEVSKEEYEECPATVWGGTPLKSEKIFLSPKSVEGFPENIDYMKEWGFK